VGSIVVTLGPSGTCSEFVLLQNLSRFPQPVTVKLFPSYEPASEAVENGEADFVLVAAAFPGLNGLVFGPRHRLRIVDCFLSDTPELVIATGLSCSDNPRTVACAAAPLPVVRARYPNAEIVTALSNSDAAQLVRKGIADAAFTTRIAAQAERLTPISSFGFISMGWIVMGQHTSEAVVSAGR